MGEPTSEQQESYDTSADAENAFLKDYRLTIVDTFYIPSVADVRQNQLLSSIKSFMTSTLIGNLATFIIGATLCGVVLLGAMNFMSFNTSQWLTFQALVTLLILCGVLAFW